MKSNRWMRSAGGFTLLEMTAVTSLIAVLSGLFVVTAHSSVHEARAVACETNRTLYEDMEQQFQDKAGRPSIAISELVTSKLVNKSTCPQGGVLAWEIIDPNLGWSHQSLVCSIHGQKSRIRKAPAGSTSSVAPVAVPVAPPVAPPVVPPGSVPVVVPVTPPVTEPVAGPVTVPVAVPVTPPAPAPSAALSDGFSDADAVGWIPVSGTEWEVAGGKYVGGTTGKGKGEHKSFAGEPGWTDYTVDVKTNLTAGGEAGVMFRTTDANKLLGYVFGFDAKKKEFTLSIINNGGVGRTFASAAAPAGFVWTGKEHAVSIDVKGSTFTATVDGVKAVTGTDTLYSKGGIGLRVGSGSVATFDDVKVTTK